MVALRQEKLGGDRGYERLKVKRGGENRGRKDPLVEKE